MIYRLNNPISSIVVQLSGGDRKLIGGKDSIVALERGYFPTQIKNGQRTHSVLVHYAGSEAKSQIACLRNRLMADLVAIRALKTKSQIELSQDEFFRPFTQKREAAQKLQNVGLNHIPLMKQFFTALATKKEFLESFNRIKYWDLELSQQEALQLQKGVVPPVLDALEARRDMVLAILAQTTPRTELINGIPNEYAINEILKRNKR